MLVRLNCTFRQWYYALARKTKPNTAFQLSGELKDNSLRFVILLILKMWVNYLRTLKALVLLWLLSKNYLEMKWRIYITLDFNDSQDDLTQIWNNCKCLVFLSCRIKKIFYEDWYVSDALNFYFNRPSLGGADMLQYMYVTVKLMLFWCCNNGIASCDAWKKKRIILNSDVVQNHFQFYFRKQLWIYL